MNQITTQYITENGACYEQGRWLGNRIYSGNISWINEKKLRHAHDFYMKHGGKTIMLARFIPIVRAFAPLIAGAAKMNGLRFELFSGAGAIVWAVSIVGAGSQRGEGTKVPIWRTAAARSRRKAPDSGWHGGVEGVTGS